MSITARFSAGTTIGVINTFHRNTRFYYYTRTQHVKLVRRKRFRFRTMDPRANEIRNAFDQRDISHTHAERSSRRDRRSHDAFRVVAVSVGRIALVGR